MSVQITEIKSADIMEIIVQSRNITISIAILAFLVLTYGTLISLIMFSLSDVQNNLPKYLWSIFLNSATAVIFTNAFLYLSFYKTTIARTGNILRIRSFGIFSGFKITRVTFDEIQDVSFVKTENPFTANYSLKATLFLTNSKRKSNTFSLPRENIDDSMDKLNQIFGREVKCI